MKTSHLYAIIPDGFTLGNGRITIRSMNMEKDAIYMVQLDNQDWSNLHLGFPKHWITHLERSICESIKRQAMYRKNSWTEKQRQQLEVIISILS